SGVWAKAVRSDSVVSNSVALPPRPNRALCSSTQSVACRARSSANASSWRALADTPGPLVFRCAAMRISPNAARPARAGRASLSEPQNLYAVVPGHLKVHRPLAQFPPNAADRLDRFLQAAAVALDCHLHAHVAELAAVRVDPVSRNEPLVGH